MQLPVPLESVAWQRAVEPTAKLTVPVGVLLPPLTVAEYVTEVPWVVEFVETLTLVVVELSPPLPPNPPKERALVPPPPCEPP